MIKFVICIRLSKGEQPDPVFDEEEEEIGRYGIHTVNWQKLD